MSAPDFPEERKVVDAGRIPVDGLYTSIFKAFPSEINEAEADIPSPTTATPTTTSTTATPPLDSRSNTPVSASPQLQIPEAAKPRQDSKRSKKKKKKSRKA